VDLVPNTAGNMYLKNEALTLSESRKIIFYFSGIFAPELYDQTL